MAANTPRTLGQLALCLVLLAGAAAEAAAAMGAGRTDLLEGAPYYRSYGKSQPAAGAVVTLPIRLDPSSVELAGDDERQQALRLIAAEMNRHLLTLDWARPLDLALPENGAPQVYVGSAAGEYAPAAAVETAEPDTNAPMIIHVQFPSIAWRTALGAALRDPGVQGALVLTVGFSEFPKSYRSTFKKRVVLGTGYETDIRFLSAELEPVHVLSVAGLLVDVEGKVVRAGSEGILSEDAPFWAQALGARKELDTGAVLQLLENERREDLPGRPLTWQVALENLVAQLLGEQARVIE